MIRAAILCAFWPLAVLAETVPEPADYRMDDYRGPVPATLNGATVVDDDAAHALWLTGRVAFIDVLPRAPKPDNLPEGTIWRDQPRLSIPGSIWLPNVGYGALAAVTEDYFKSGLVQATGGDMDHPVVFFCLAECWMSWNATKRALGYGHKRVFWYPDGTDGWRFNNYPTAVSEPVDGY